MGDPRRFDLMARLVALRQRPRRVVDVAGGRGGLQAALRRLGFKDVVSVDVRPQYAKGRVCAVRGCKTVLSVYNGSRLCAACNRSLIRRASASSRGEAAARTAPASCAVRR